LSTAHDFHLLRIAYWLNVWAYKILILSSSVSQVLQDLTTRVDSHTS